MPYNTARSAFLGAAFRSFNMHRHPRYARKSTHAAVQSGYTHNTKSRALAMGYWLAKNDYRPTKSV